jgi:hypothetical protein
MVTCVTCVTYLLSACCNFVAYKKIKSMQPISFMTKEDVKAAVLEALAESPPATTPQIDNTIHGLKALANFLGIGITKAWQLKKSGQIPYYQAGKKLIFKESEVLKALQKVQ